MKNYIQAIYKLFLLAGWKLDKKNGNIVWVDKDGDIKRSGSGGFNPRLYSSDELLEKYVI